ncbi:type II toxin-antitoxin system PemK/MazF family toxin [Halomonas sp. ISL-60]|uniref:type II toxin-antitoxin system PemK/MazF family toxin n=1 Tax=Halomonas sp. ISL-56 TaxID=2819149 RepID=UPI001BE50FA9|nr:type II toxin-antitoxin system PemK/MazF family toxin [Halomonas sp. ISL-56]MBT2773326.1 type II toxin-antitoxin system PemK/MazF family toxin [Halomonas sp. ISL-60]MBT2801896.1 type II toxin-antitoxin system PemK/MazF family toxin [Halomonas sp. ISL-56]
MRRGDLMTVAPPGEFGKPRPALVIQSDQFSSTATVTVLLLSSTLIDAPLMRIEVLPTSENGLQKRSQVMVDKPMTVKRDKLGEPFGHLDDSTMVMINRSLALFLGFA